MSHTTQMGENGALVARVTGVLARRRGDLVAIGTLVLLVFLYFSPALKDGPWFAPADIGRGLSLLTAAAHSAPNHNDVNGDIITQGIPWYMVSWQLVHHGELPLWSSLTGNGMPQLLNFESGSFALPSLVGYLFPLSIAFTVTLGLKLLIAGVGTYVFLRLVGARPVGALFGGATFMLSGPLAGWLGWSISGVFCWVGALAAGFVYCYRGTGRTRELVAVAVPVAFAIYGGFPEAYALVAICLAALLVGVAASLVLQRRAIALRRLVRLVAGAVVGLALSAPLWLAGLPVLSGSARRGGDAAIGLSSSMAALVFAQGYDGLPTQFHPSEPLAARFFGTSNYYESAAYVGVLALCLAFVALVVCWRRPIVAGLAACGLAAALIGYRLGSADPVQALVRALGLGSIDVNRVLAMLAFALACLGGLGLETVLSRYREARVRRACLAGLGLFVLVDIGLLVNSHGVPALYLHDRLRSLIWPTGMLVVAAGALLLVLVAERRGRAPAALRLATAVVVALQLAFVLFAGVGINTYAANAYDEAPAVVALARVVGTEIVGIDTGDVTCPGPAGSIYCGIKGFTGEGFYPNINVGLGIDELGLHDPLIPRATFATWPVPSAGQTLGGTNIFYPDVDSVALARDYGASYVLAGPGRTPPTGMRLVETILAPKGTSKLYAVPGAGRFSFAGGPDTVTRAQQVNDAEYALQLNAPQTEVLHVAITAFSGWHASAGGRPLPVTTGPYNLLEVRVPAGTHRIVLTYWPRRLTYGFVLCVIGLVALLADALVRTRRTRGISGLEVVR